MIWMSWRQFRAQALVGAVALAAFLTYVVILGVDIRDTYDANVVQCDLRGECDRLWTQFLDAYRMRLYFLDVVVLAVPAVIGVFWGAPLIARELEAGTHRLVWNQSVTRRRWLLIKLMVVGLAGMAVVGVCSLVVTWAASRYDVVAAGPLDPLGAGRFSGLLFGARNIAPVAYAGFALVLGATLGMLVRRTVPGMALTLLIFVTVQAFMPNVVRPHLMAPVTVSKPMTADAINQLSRLGSITGGAVVAGVKIPDAWVTSTSELLTADGRPLDRRRFDACISGPPGDSQDEHAGTFGGAAQCLGNLDLHVTVTYQPAERYWSFQWRESALFLALTALLTGFGLWRVQRRLT